MNDQITNNSTASGCDLTAAGGALQDCLAVTPSSAPVMLASRVSAAAHDATLHQQSAARNCVGNILASLLSARSAADKPTDAPDASVPNGYDTYVEAALVVISTAQPNGGDGRTRSTVDTSDLRQRVLIDGTHGGVVLERFEGHGWRDVRRFEPQVGHLHHRQV
eukprot:6172391-Pleurochrysis_carterae.AAC.1